MGRLGRLALALAAAGLVSATAEAHGVRVFAKAQGATVLCRGYFSGGGPCIDCPVKVYLPGGALVRQGRTDAKGEFIFEATVRADLRVALEAGEGHAAEFTLPAAALPSDLPAPAGVEASPANALPTATGPAPEQAPTTLPAAAADRLGALVEAAVRKEILGLRADLEAMQERGPGPTEIIGGIGYIVGLAGVALYVHSRHGLRKRDRVPSR